MCHSTWITQELISECKKIPTEVTRFSDTMRQTPKDQRIRTKITVAKFDTSALAKIQW